MDCLKFYGTPDIVFAEVPGNISLSFQITGCPLRCEGCHSAYTWKDTGTHLTAEILTSYLDKYNSLITCVLFFGGEWFPEELSTLLKIVNERKLATCLYSGYDDVPDIVRNELTFLKSGAWREDLGGLDSKNTNQQFLDLKNNVTLNHKFWRDNG